MNKKLLLATMSLAALVACTDNDFESQSQKVAEEISPIQFELVNGDDALTRASWNETGKYVNFSAKDGDLFTLYHGGTCAAVDDPLTGFQNAIYTAQPGTPATLTTPSMINAGKAVMIWPADTSFNSRTFTGGKFQITIPAAQTDFVNQLPYASDLITIGDYTGSKHKTTDYNTEGYDRKYPIFMRQMGSLLTLKADYNGTDAEIAKLYEGGADAGDDPIAKITVDKITLSTAAGTEFTKQVPIKFTAANANWPAAATLHHAWTYVTSFDVASIAAADKTTTLSAEDKSLLDGNQGARIVMLPQAAISETTPSADAPTGVVSAAVVVDTYYGKVVVAAPGVIVDGCASKYTAEEIKDAWIRYISATTAKKDYETKAASATTSDDADKNGKYKTTSNIAAGMMQTINWFGSADRISSNATVKDEPVGGLLTRFVKVDLKKLDMSGLHIKTDKQLRDVVRVWKKLGLDAVTVYLDGNDPTDANGQFEISQQTIATINAINAATTGKSFKVMPCQTAKEVCKKIVIKDGGNVPDLAFIVDNATKKADVVLKAGQNWSWSEKTVAGKKAVTIATTTGISSIINEGTFASNATATIAIYDNTAPTPAQVSTIPFVNAKDAKWNVIAGDLTVQFDVTNYGTVNIKKGAEYHQDIIGTAATTFTNEALTKPQRFLDLEDPADDVEEIGKVNNAGVFAATGSTAKTGVINNYGLIEHGEYPGDAYNKDAKTFITANQQGAANFAAAFNKATGTENKLGRINLPYSNKDEDNISVNAALSTGFVSVTVSSGDAPSTKELNLTVVGDKVNYVIIKGGIETVTEMTDKIKYIEFADEAGTEIAWQAGTSADPKTATYDGLIVLSPINIKLYTTVKVNKATYLGNKMYVGGTFTNAGFIGYYGDTSSEANVKKNYITY